MIFPEFDGEYNNWSLRFDYFTVKIKNTNLVALQKI